MKDMLKQTIIKKFRELIVVIGRRDVHDYESIRFIDNKSNRIYLEYDFDNNCMDVDITYFMLHYFGFSENDPIMTSFVKELFIDLINDLYNDNILDNSVIVHFYIPHKR